MMIHAYVTIVGLAADSVRIPPPVESVPPFLRRESAAASAGDTPHTATVAEAYADAAGSDYKTDDSNHGMYATYRHV